MDKETKQMFELVLQKLEKIENRQENMDAYTGVAEPLFRRVVSHASGIMEPPFQLEAIAC